MSKQQAGMTDVSSAGERVRLGWSAAFAGVIAILLLGGIWYFTSRAMGDLDWTVAILLAVLHFFLVVALEHALEAAPISAAQRYRLAFAVSGLIALLAWFILLSFPEAKPAAHRSWWRSCLERSWEDCWLRH